MEFIKLVIMIAAPLSLIAGSVSVLAYIQFELLNEIKQTKMYYKIENAECELYKKLHEMRSQELLWEEENKAAINEKVGLEWESFLGHPGQQTWSRVTEYIGFKFSDPDKVDSRIWKRHTEHDAIFVPNRRYKVGREISDFLRNGLKGHRFDIVFEIFGIEYPSRFSFPVVEICNKTIVVYFGEDYNIDSDDVIEITSKEFNEIREKAYSLKKELQTQES